MRIFDKNMILLLIAAGLVLVCMFMFGPAESLDSLFFYTEAEAQRILYEVSVEESARYFFNEIFDMVFIILYSAFLYLCFRKLRLTGVLLLACAFSPGVFDLLETSCILYALKNPGQHDFLLGLGYITSIKWLLALISLGCLIFFCSRAKFLSKN